ncbi:hypothetical protein Tco_0924414 [Tanacetum coccineum]|uniref:Reverse transcriptase domain-containing protein n=1 Tax=Tanacetum coccineum TaxID=301880 RepID=A0ABQ5D3S5_9ASTR
MAYSSSLLSEVELSSSLDSFQAFKWKVSNFPADFVVDDFEPTPEPSEEYSQEVLGFSNVISSGNPTPYYDPIVSTASPTLTPFGDSDFLLFEEADSSCYRDFQPTPIVEPTYYEPFGDILLLEAILNSDPSPPPPNQGNYFPETQKDLKICEANSSVNEPPEVELKDLPPHLEYAFLEVHGVEICIDYRKFRMKATEMDIPPSHHGIRLLEDSRETNFIHVSSMASRVYFQIPKFDVVIRDKKGAENLAADHLSRLENPHQDKLENKEITETFPLETLGSVALRVDRSVIPTEKTSFQRCPKHSSGMTLLGSKSVQDQMIRRCSVNVKEALDILELAIMGPTGDHHGANLTSKKDSTRFLKPHRLCGICPLITRASQSSASFGNPDILILSTNVYL